MNPWLIPLLGIPVFALSYWTSNALYDFLRAYRSTAGFGAKESTYPIETQAFDAHMSQPVTALLRTPGLTLGTVAAALRRHSDEEVERLRHRYVFRLGLQLVASALWITTAVILFRG